MICLYIMSLYVCELYNYQMYEPQQNCEKLGQLGSPLKR